MKLNQKFFLISLILIIMLILVLGIFMIQYTFRKNLEHEKQNSIHTYNNILNSVYNKLKEKEVTSYYSNFSTQAQQLSVILGNILKSELSSQSMTSFLYQEANLLVRNGQELFDDLLNIFYCEDYDLHTYITKLDNQYQLFTYSKIQVDEKDYLFILGYNIQDIYQMRQDQSLKFIYIGLSMAFFISIILYVFSYLITKKVATINMAAKKIAEGNYDTRIFYVHGKDEVNELATSFNTMADSIQSYIEKIHLEAQAKQDFIDNFLHELRTPITNIKLSSTLLSTGIITIENKERYAKKLLEINEEIEYIHNMTTKLIDIFLLKLDLENLPEINLSKLIHNICKKQNKKYKECNIQIKTKIMPNVFKKADKDLITSLLINILNNSFRSYEKKEKGIIKLALSTDAITITDYGKGIPENELDKITQPFYTLNKSRNIELSGIGLRCPFM